LLRKKKDMQSLFKKILPQICLVYSLIWLATGILAAIYNPNDLLVTFYLGLGVLVTLYFFKEFKINNRTNE
jgi:hypothetical protein